MRALSRVRKKPVGVGRIVMRRMQVVTFDDTLRTIRFWPNSWLVIFVVADMRRITMRPTGLDAARAFELNTPHHKPHPACLEARDDLPAR